jgi:uncharacterized protein (TIGR01777 family)
VKILLSGSSGLIGSSLLPFFRAGEHHVTRLVRRPAHSEAREIAWDPAEGKLDPVALESHDAVVHLSGANLGEGRWTAARKALLVESRMKSTRLLAQTLASLTHPPRVMVSASAIGFYGNRGDETLTEESASGSGFLADLCRDWEAACQPAAAKGIRVVHLRTGMVLSPAGGALGKMLTPFKMGVGGVIGSGQQFMSWIALDELLAVILFALTHDVLRGPVNATAPNLVTNREFTKTLGRVLGRPTIFPMPAFAARLAFGEMADELLLSSGRVLPAKLQAAGYKFQFPDLEPALRHVLGK